MFKLIPAYKDYLWGGTKLREKYGKDCKLDKVAESWELSTHKDGISIIGSGEHKGKSLLEYVGQYKKTVLGSKCTCNSDIPILIKFIDAKQPLSIQVHPNNDYAMKNENDFGKTEMWYIIEADEDAKLIYGFKKDITKDEFKNAIENNELESLVNEVPVKEGDVFFMNPGTMHAIGKGIVIAEIQQRSNITYRIYDFGRRGADGKLRELHIDKALDVTNLESSKESKNCKKDYNFVEENGGSIANLSKCEYFNVDLVKVDNTYTRICTDESFEAITLIEGSAKIKGKDELDVEKGETIFIPSGYGKYAIEGQSKVIITSL